MIDSNIDCLFINPRDLIGVWPYTKPAYVIAVLEKSGITSKIIDPNAERLSNEDVVNLIISSSPKVICVSIFPSTLPDAYQLINTIKKNVPDVEIVVEGYMINADPRTVTELGVTYGFANDYELSFLEFYKAIYQGHPVDKLLPGLIYNSGRELNVNKAGTLKNLDVLPNPALYALPIGKYYSASSNKKYMALSISRGCPFKCNFCANPSQMLFRNFSHERVIEQIRSLIHDQDVQWIEFMDLIFSVNRKYTIELCKLIVDSKLEFEWGCQTRIDLVDSELLKLMYKAGCRKIAFGVESGSESIRASTDKNISNEQFIEVFAICKNIGIKTMAYFVLGHPGESLTDMRKSLNFALKLKPFNAVFIKMIPLPDVAVFKVGLKEGLYSEDVWFNYMRGEVEHPLYHPADISQKQIDDFYKWAYLRFYLSPRTIMNYLPLFTNPKFLFRTVRIFASLVFGSTKFSYCS